MASEKLVVLTKDNFDQEVVKSDKPVLIDFWASWCGPCRAVAPIMDDIAEEYDGEVKVCKVNVDDEGELSQKFRIMSIPTIMMYKNGEMVEKIIGSRSKDEFVQLVKKHI